MSSEVNPLFFFSFLQKHMPILLTLDPKLRVRHHSYAWTLVFNCRSSIERWYQSKVTLTSRRLLNDKANFLLNYLRTPHVTHTHINTPRSQIRTNFSTNKRCLGHSATAAMLPIYSAIHLVPLNSKPGVKADITNISIYRLAVMRQLRGAASRPTHLTEHPLAFGFIVF